MRNHFDDNAATWDDDPGTVRRAREVAEAVATRVPLGRGMRVLEYGAGTGLVSQVLADRVGPLTLADISAGMRKVLGDKIGTGVLPEGSRVWGLDLEQEDAPEGEEFELVLSSMVLHHVPDLDAVLGRLAGLLADGGWLAVADLDAEDGSFHAHHDTFKGHHGFDRGQLGEALERAGLTGVSFADAATIEKEGTAYPVFLATARKGAPRD